MWEINTEDVGDRGSKGLEVDLPDGGVREATTPVGTAGSIAGVSSATKASPASTGTPKPIAVKPKPYVVIAEDNESQSEFDSLRDAILAASSGSTVEIQESGRHKICRPISLHNIALTVAAKQGVLPTIVADLEDSEEPLIRTDSDLSLRGLIVAAEGDELDEDVDGTKVGALIHVREAMLKCSECRFTAREGSPIAVLKTAEARRGLIANCTQCTASRFTGNLPPTDILLLSSAWWSRGSLCHRPDFPIARMSF